MSRLIDADAFAEKIKEISIRQGYYDFYPKSMSVGEILDSVIADLKGEGVCGFENAPTADAVPVVHGHWIQDGEPPMFSLTCSVCGQKYFNHYLQPHANYCSMCGAKMDEVTE